jgi:lipid-A-disaccharide synthase
MKLTLIAGEPSGDRLGAALMAALKTLQLDVQFHGVGGPLMQAQGLESLFPMEELSVMGLAEILPKYRALKRRIAQTAAATLTANPAALITIDSPDFCLRVASIVKAARPALRTIHYVAPSVWAWRPDRAAKMARFIDHVLALLPFEPPYMIAAGMTCDFVGHPVVAEETAPKTPQPGPLILALPGSRRAEIARLAPVIGGALAHIKTRHPDTSVVLPTLANLAPLVREISNDWPIRPQIIENAVEKRAAFANATAAIAASGTVSLELAANACPMVIAYRMHPLTHWLMQRAALIDTVTLVNLVSQTRAVPEFLGPKCQPAPIAHALLALMQAGPERDAQTAAMALTMQRLGKGEEPPALRAAKSVLAQLAR